jgi:hypothetical protein
MNVIGYVAFRNAVDGSKQRNSAWEVMDSILVYSSTHFMPIYSFCHGITSAFVIEDFEWTLIFGDCYAFPSSEQASPLLGAAVDCD